MGSGNVRLVRTGLHAEMSSWKAYQRVQAMYVSAEIVEDLHIVIEYVFSFPVIMKHITRLYGICMFNNVCNIKLHPCLSRPRLLLVYDFYWYLLEKVDQAKYELVFLSICCSLLSVCMFPILFASLSFCIAEPLNWTSPSSNVVYARHWVHSINIPNHLFHFVSTTPGG